MKKMSLFYKPKVRKVKELVRNLEVIQNQNEVDRKKLIKS